MLRYNTKHIPNAFGMINTGVSCHFNTMLQCFISCSSIVELFKKISSLQTRNELCASLWNLISTFHNSNTDSTNAAYQVWKTFQRIAPGFAFGQQDANEGFLLFLDKLNAPEIEELFKVRWRVYTKCFKCNHISINAVDENSFIEYTEPINKNLIQTAKVSDFKCQGCGDKESQKIQIKRLTMVSEIIVLISPTSSFARSGGYTKRSGSCIDEQKIPALPYTFDIKSNESNDFIYKIIAKSEHSGTRTGGHYWAVCERNNGHNVSIDNTVSIGEYELNDLTVRSGSILPSSDTYMAWYHLT